MKKNTLKLFLLFLLGLLLPPIGLILFFVFIKKNKSFSYVSGLGFLLGIILIPFVTLPLIIRMVMYNKCKTYGSNYKAVIERPFWYCVNDIDGDVYMLYPDGDDVHYTKEEVEERRNSGVAYKPIIYLYPKDKMEVTVKLGYPNNLTHTYPKYNHAWNVIAYPDGTLKDIESNRELYSLYWEGNNRVNFSTNDGFVVSGEDTIKFLEDKLSILGLNEKESEEFIIYWLPKLENNKYNYIRFATIDEINENMPLYISGKPDSIIRVLMLYKPLDKYKKVKEQELITPKRYGFSVVEWGGTELK